MPRKKSPKTFILDTNVILHDGNCIEHFEENDIIIPLTVIEEIDHFKRGGQVINLHAREFTRKLDSLSGNALFSRGISLGPGKGKIKIAIAKKVSDHIRQIFNEDNADHRILSVAYELQKKEKGERSMILVSKDVNLRMKAKALGLPAEDYTTDRVASIDELYSGKDIIDQFDDDLISAFYQSPFRVDKEQITRFLNGHTLIANKYFIFRNNNHSVLAKYPGDSDTFMRVDKSSAYGIKARNAEQTFALDALLDPGIPLVSLSGNAGTGKTLLALAAALEVRREYRQMFIARPVVPLSNKDIGFLPGDVDSKLAPYMQPLWDNLKVIQDQFPETEKNHKIINALLEEKKLVIEPLSYIRGRSLQRIFFIVDEAQNLSPHEIKTIITRAGEGVKMVFTGDITQIDHPYLDSQSNGLSYLIEHFKGQSVYAHINLEKGERSELAELASRLL